MDPEVYTFLIFQRCKFFGGVILTPKMSLKSSFLGVKMTPDIEEVESPPKRSYPVPKIFTPLSELK